MICLHIPLNTCKHCSNIISRAPSVLQDVQAQLASSVDVGMKHLADKLDGGWLVRVLLLKMHHKAECAIFEGCIGGSNDDSVPAR